MCVGYLISFKLVSAKSGEVMASVQEDELLQQDPEEIVSRACAALLPDAAAGRAIAPTPGPPTPSARR